MVKKLTEKQKDFCKNFVKTGNLKESAKKAGYKDSTIKHRIPCLLKDPSIKNYMEELKQQEYSREEYINELDRVMELALKAENASILIKAIEAKGKAFGFDKLTADDLKENRKNVVKDDLFKRIQEKVDVFEKFNHPGAQSDIPGDNS